MVWTCGVPMSVPVSNSMSSSLLLISANLTPGNSTLQIFEWCYYMKISGRLPEKLVYRAEDCGGMYQIIILILPWSCIFHSNPFQHEHFLYSWELKHCACVCFTPLDGGGGQKGRGGGLSRPCLKPHFPVSEKKPQGYYFLTQKESACQFLWIPSRNMSLSKQGMLFVSITGYSFPGIPAECSRVGLHTCTPLLNNLTAPICRLWTIWWNVGDGLAWRNWQQRPADQEQRSGSQAPPFWARTWGGIVLL